MHKALYCSNYIPKAFSLEIINIKAELRSLFITIIDEVKALLSNKRERNKFKYLFLKVLSELINDKEKIYIKSEDCKDSLSEYFYIVELIKKDIIILAYVHEFIQNINNDNRKNVKALRKIIISNIILELIKYD